MKKKTIFSTLKNKIILLKFEIEFDYIKLA